MGASFGGDDDVISDINITPFVDIILVVLIIFMVTATTIVRQSIQVNLPSAANSSQAEGTSLGVTLMADGRLLLDGEPVTTEGLVERLRKEKAGDAEVTVLIAAERNVAHGRVVWVLDKVQDEGITKFAINIDPAQAIGPDPRTSVPGVGPASAPAPAAPPEGG